MLTYFMECYFNMTFYDDELDSLIEEFNLNENIKKRKMFKSEIEHILKEENWEIAKKIIKEYGFRNMDKEKMTWFFHTVLEKMDAD